VLDEHGFILFVNETWREFARENGLDPKAVSVGTNYLHVCYNANGDEAEEAVAFAAGIRSVLDGKRAFFMLEYPCHSPTEKRWFAGRITPFPGNGSRRVIVSHEDITKRKLAEEALEESERRYNQLAEQSLTFTWEINTDGIFTFVSPVAFSVIGYRPEELATKMHFFELHPETGRDKFTRLIFSLFDRKESFKDLQYPIKKKSGDIIFISTNGLPLLDRNGDLLGYRGSYTDITERKRSEQELAVRERRFQDLVENIPNYIVRYDKNLHRTYVNPAWEKASGFSAADVVNLQNPEKPRIKINRSNEYANSLKRVLSSGVSDRIEFLWEKNHNEILALEYFLVPEFGETGVVTGVLAIGHDLTARRQREAELQQYSARLKEKTIKLEEMNTALRVLLDQRTHDCQVIRDQVLSNMRLLILPYLENIKQDTKQSSVIRNIEVIQRNFDNITSSFTRSLNAEKQKLSIMEIRVADLIHSGMTSKEIADMLHISIRTAEAHRASIRRKLNLSGKKMRLNAFLDGLYKA